MILTRNRQAGSILSFLGSHNGSARDTHPAEGMARRTRLRVAAQLVARREQIIAAWWTSQFDIDRLNRYGLGDQASFNRAAITQHYLAPLLGLLIAYVRSGNQNCSDVYLDERLRYAPHLASPSDRADFFAEVLAADEKALLAAVSSAADSGEFTSLLHYLHAPLRDTPTGAALRVLAVGDCLMNEVRVALCAECRRAGFPLDFRMLYFSASEGRAASADQVLEFLDSFPADLIALSFLSYEGLPLYPALLRDASRSAPRNGSGAVATLVGVMWDFLGQIRARTDAPVLLHNASGLPLTRYRKRLPWIPPLSTGRRLVLNTINEAITQLAQNTQNTILIDEFGVAVKTGLRECSRPLIQARFTRDAFFHTSSFGHILAPLYVDVIKSFRELRRAKVLLVDFDNTLWSGVMADGEVEHRHRFQLLLRKLKDAGILLVAVSKNDPASIRWGELSLAPDDFVLLKVGWNQKVQSIREAAQELDLGLDTFVLIDDSPEERELVKIHLPLVRTLDPEDGATERWLERMLCFPNTRETSEAAARTDMYRQQIQRRKVSAQSVDYPEMMRSLKLEARFRRATSGDIDRIVELVQRTNQFNTTTIRYGKTELLGLLASETHALYVATLSDSLGSMGLVSVVIVERRARERVIESFVMSCRAMGFGLEQVMLRETIAAESAHGGERFIGRFVPTDRNTPARDVFARYGFTPAADGLWETDLSSGHPPPPDWLHVRLDGR